MAEVTGRSKSDRRGEPRKVPLDLLPAKVETLSSAVSEQSAELKKKLLQFSQQMQTSKKPDHEIKVILSLGLVQSATIVNLSKVGILLRTKTRFKEGQYLNLSFLIPDVLENNQISVYAICQVVRCLPHKKLEHEFEIGLLIDFMLSEHSRFYCQYLDSLPKTA